MRRTFRNYIVQLFTPLLTLDLRNLLVSGLHLTQSSSAGPSYQSSLGFGAQLTPWARSTFAHFPVLQQSMASHLLCYSILAHLSSQISLLQEIDGSN